MAKSLEIQTHCFEVFFFFFKDKKIQYILLLSCLGIINLAGNRVSGLARQLYGAIG